ncbi:DUF3239 domain-containing protein [Corynebacterium glyciniphilum]|uniref:DUF3239 domain-containing protein n=1 Tax=Corynebacterium glyciniphilum TaxID=1404244 RepID=UPI00264FE082|nr:DUF3239 domain-containing protein [Corynebacterium glyciniphilum]MDN5684248.1 DUF3239 domain-containing protein [Corynebacterium glyciniphilum]MDN6707253.1 DUF3239 domain-containing protein [Corynebacterium glyciniphilum]
MVSFNFTVDEPFARKHNEFFRDSRRFQWSAGLMGAIMVAAAVILFVVVDAGWAVIVGIAAVIMALICFIMVPVFPRQLGSPQRYYDAYPLAPTVVAQVNPRDVVLMSLVDTAATGTARSRPALALRTVTSIPGVERKVGERVPAMAVTGMRSVGHQDHWEQISPMPVAWGTQDRSVVAEAEKAIPESEWSRLESLIDRLEDVQKTRHLLLELD